ncbi:hypothetical protein D3C86_1841610 [compost metagenome]
MANQTRPKASSMNSETLRLNSRFSASALCTGGMNSRRGSRLWIRRENRLCGSLKVVFLRAINMSRSSSLR